jgi:hypothetical protein
MRNEHVDGAIADIIWGLGSAGGRVGTQPVFMHKVIGKMNMCIHSIKDKKFIASLL